MERRDFLRRSMLAGLAAGTIGLDPVWGNSANYYGAPFDMVAARGGEAEIMFEKAIATLGGMKSFIKKNQTVVVKPNIGWDVSPEKAANTNPKLVGKIVQHCLLAGAKAVYVFDNTCDNWQKSYATSGIEKAVKEAGGKIVSGNSEGYYHEVVIPKGIKLKKAKVHEMILNSDVFINVPILKNHGGATLSIAMKNLMGIVWDREFWHKNDLHQCIADFASYRKPDLNVIDAYRVMKKNGPRGISEEDVITMKALLISKDMVASDAAATKLFGLNPANIGFITQAEKLGVGTTHLENLNINRIKV